jgi:hypothetical protein
MVYLWSSTAHLVGFVVRRRSVQLAVSRRKGSSKVLTIIASAEYRDCLDNGDGDENKCAAVGVKLRNAALSELGVAPGFGIGRALGGGLSLCVAAPKHEATSPAAKGVGYLGTW